MTFKYGVPETNNIPIRAIDGFLTERVNLIKDNVCPECHTTVLGFNDKLSQEEFLITGLCQSCQNEIFN